MLKQMAQLGYKPKANIMLRASDDPSWGKLGALGDYAIGSPDWHPALNYPGVKELNAVVKAKTGQPANPSVGPAYASIKVAAAAIEKAGSLDRAAIRDALAATDMQTVVGHVKFGPKNSTGGGHSSGDSVAGRERWNLSGRISRRRSRLLIRFRPPSRECDEAGSGHGDAARGNAHARRLLRIARFRLTRLRQ